MDIFKVASKQKLRFETNIGMLTVEDLWDVPLTGNAGSSLDDLAKAFNRRINTSAEESFVGESKVDPKLKLGFEIVKSIIETKLKDKEKAEKAAATKQRNLKIKELIAKKKDEDLEGKTTDELLALLEDECEE